MTTAAVYKTSISLRPHIWAQLQKLGNRSLVINEALEIFFDRSAHMKKADCAYWDKVQKSLAGKTGDYVSLNNAQNPVTDEMLEDTLWK